MHQHHDSHLAPTAQIVLDYLEHHLPDYPFDPDIDTPFVLELLDDFPSVDILEQIKALRWYLGDQPPSSPRLSLRRWIRRAHRSAGSYRYPGSC